MTRRVRIRQNSRYVSTPLVQDDTDPRNVYWGVWNRIKFLSSPGDLTFEVSAPYRNRLDLLASTYYKDPTLWWVIADTNDVDDPLDIPIGMKLRIPAATAVYAALRGAAVS